jgi:hypothetical protein
MEFLDEGEPMTNRLPKIWRDEVLIARDEFARLANKLPTEGDIVLWQLAHKIVDAIDELLKENRKRIEAGE